MIALLAFLQFSIVLDFMILSPLGAFLMPALAITPSEFGWVVSVYAFAAGLSGFITAGFADRFDRKKFLLFYYTGFVLGTLLCGLAPSYTTLLVARIITGIFAGAIGSIVFSIVTDLFRFEVRGRVMGVVQTAFAASQVLGLPLGLYFSNLYGWHAPFLLIVGVATAGGFAILWGLRPVRGHLTPTGGGVDRSPLHHLFDTLKQPRYLFAFATTALLSTGGFMIMPFSSAFTVNNVGISTELLPRVYFITGIVAAVAGPLLGRATDRWGSFRLFVFGTALSALMVWIYTHLSITPLVWMVVINSVLFVGISARIISSQTLLSTIPDPKHRGAFMAVGASVQQLSGGLASALAGLIVVQEMNGQLGHFDRLGYVVIASMVFTLLMMRRLSTR